MIFKCYGHLQYQGNQTVKAIGFEGLTRCKRLSHHCARTWKQIHQQSWSRMILTHPQSPPTSHLWLFIPTSNHFGSFHGTYDHPAIESDPGHASRWPAARSQGISNLKAKERNKERHIIGKRLSQKEFKNFNRCQKNLGKKKTSRITVTFRGHFPSLPCPALTCPRLPLTLVTSAISPFLFASSRCRWAISWWLVVAYNERSHGDVLETVNHQQ